MELLRQPKRHVEPDVTGAYHEDARSTHVSIIPSPAADQPGAVSSAAATNAGNPAPAHVSTGQARSNPSCASTNSATRTSKGPGVVRRRRLIQPWSSSSSAFTAAPPWAPTPSGTPGGVPRRG